MRHKTHATSAVVFWRPQQVVRDFCLERRRSEKASYSLLPSLAMHSYYFILSLKLTRCRSNTCGNFRTFEIVKIATSWVRRATHATNRRTGCWFQWNHALAMRAGFVWHSNIIPLKQLKILLTTFQMKDCRMEVQSLFTVGGARRSIRGNSSSWKQVPKMSRNG